MLRLLAGPYPTDAHRAQDNVGDAESYLQHRENQQSPDDLSAGTHPGADIVPGYWEEHRKTRSRPTESGVVQSIVWPENVCSGFGAICCQTSLGDFAVSREKQNRWSLTPTSDWSEAEAPDF